MKNDLKIFAESEENQAIKDTTLEKQKQHQSSVPKSKRPTAKAYFKEIARSRESLAAFIQEHLAPAVAGRTLHNVGGAYYGAIAKNTREVATDIVHNTACNYKAFKKKLEIYSISPEELSALLEVEVNYKPIKKANSAPVSKKEKTINILRSKLGEYVTDNEKLESLAHSIYIELRPIMNKTR